MIRVQAEDFDPGAELDRLAAVDGAGGLTSFVGIVRGGDVSAMTLEHYPGMTERQMAAVEAEARSRWPVLEVTLIHRYGRLVPGDRIVFVGVAASHRAAAFSACEFLIDWLKTKAPFWKLEERPEGDRWVEAVTTDDDRAQRWEKAS